MNGFKYGLFAFHPPDADSIRLELLPGLSTLHTRVGDLLRDTNSSHWREWVGSTEWTKLERCARVAIRIIPSARADVDDDENQQLYQGANDARNALTLVGPNGLLHGSGWLVCGEANGPRIEDGLKSIRNFGPTDRIVQPYYTRYDECPDVTPAARARWMDRWKHACELTSKGMPRLLWYGFLAMVRGMESHEIEFKIPDCVRAAETVLGLPAGRGGGRGAFADRVMTIAPEIANDSFVGGADIHDRLRALYDHRNECVHGKIPFLRLQGLGSQGGLEAAKFEYLAEHIARRALLFGLMHPDSAALFADRDRLEDAWRNGSIGKRP